MARRAICVAALWLSACGARSAPEREDAAPDIAHDISDIAPDIAPDRLVADILPPDVLPDAGCGNDAQIAASFIPCGFGSLVGQTKDAPGVTCDQVCCVFGFAGCSCRTAQSDYNYCVPDNPAKAGDCHDMYWPSWSSGCACTP